MSNRVHYFLIVVAILAACSLLVIPMLASVRDLVTEMKAYHQDLVLEDVTITRNLRVAKPYIMQCDNEDGQWLWLTTDDGIHGYCVIHESENQKDEALEHEQKDIEL